MSERTQEMMQSREESKERKDVEEPKRFQSEKLNRGRLSTGMGSSRRSTGSTSTRIVAAPCRSVSATAASSSSSDSVQHGNSDGTTRHMLASARSIDSPHTVAASVSSSSSSSSSFLTTPAPLPSCSHSHSQASASKKRTLAQLKNGSTSDKSAARSLGACGENGSSSVNSHVSSHVSSRPYSGKRIRTEQVTPSHHVTNSLAKVSFSNDSTDTISTALNHTHTTSSPSLVESSSSFSSSSFALMQQSPVQSPCESKDRTSSPPDQSELASSSCDVTCSQQSKSSVDMDRVNLSSSPSQQQSNMEDETTVATAPPPNNDDSASMPANISVDEFECSESLDDMVSPVSSTSSDTPDMDDTRAYSTAATHAHAASSASQPSSSVIPHAPTPRFHLPASVYRSYQSSQALVVSIESALEDIDPDLEWSMWDGEQRHHPYLYYINYQEHIESTMRPILVDWMMEVSQEYSIGRETLYLAVNYMDRFLSASPSARPATGDHRSEITRHILQLLGVT